MTLTDQVAQLRELARLSSGTRMLDVLIINVLDELAQAVGRLERNEPQGQTRSRQRSGDGTSPTIDPQREGPTAYVRPPARLQDQQGPSLVGMRWPRCGYAVVAEEELEEWQMVATSVRDVELSTETGAFPLDLPGTSELELARLLRGKETAEEHQALDPIAWQMLEGAQNLRRWCWTVILIALALLVVGFFALFP